MMYTFPIVKLTTDLTGEKLNELLVNSSMNHKFPVLFFDGKNIFIYGKKRKETWGITELSKEISRLVKFPKKLNKNFLEPKNKVPLDVFMDIFFKKAHLLPGGVKFFRYPFATAGDRMPVPDQTQVDGSVSYQQGYGIDYQKNLTTDPSAKPISRTQYNAVLYDITNAINQYQTHGIPDFIPASENGGIPYPYDKYALVRFDDGHGIEIYWSKVDNNTADPTDLVNWGVFSTDGWQPGDIKDHAGTQDPSTFGRWLLCDGTIYLIADYPRLAAALGNTWGGDGVDTFAVPDLTRRVTIGSGGSGSGTIGNAVGDTGGSETHTLTIDQMPSHDHPGSTVPYGTTALQPGGGGVWEPIFGGLTWGLTIAPEGGGQAHNNIQPSAVVQKLIRY